MLTKSLPTTWDRQRRTLQVLAAHLLGQARRRNDRMFDLVPNAGGFGTPPVGPQRERVRIAGNSLVVERVSGPDLRSAEATTSMTPINGNTLRGLCQTIGFEPDPDFSVGKDTPVVDDPDAPIELDGEAAAVLGWFFLLGQRAIDVVVASVDDPQASVGRIWPEHFDYGIDLAVRPGVRCNLGASAGDSFHGEPYLYVGPWDDIRPGPAEFWNAPFGAVLGFADVATTDDPTTTATDFLARGVAALATLNS